jgi:hypothetical protein
MVFPEPQYDENLVDEISDSDFIIEIEKESSTKEWMYAHCHKCGQKLNLTDPKETRFTDDGFECKKGCRF